MNQESEMKMRSFSKIAIVAILALAMSGISFADNTCDANGNCTISYGPGNQYQVYTACPSCMPSATGVTLGASAFAGQQPVFSITGFETVLWVVTNVSTWMAILIP